MTRNIHSVVVVLEKSLDVEALIQTIQQRLISLKKSGNPSFPLLDSLCLVV